MKNTTIDEEINMSEIEDELIGHEHETMEIV